MASTETLLAFVVATGLFALMPGPAMLYAAARTLAGGRRAGLGAAFGILLGCCVHVVAAAAGLSVLFHAVPTIYFVVKLIGAGYLVWLGIGMIRSREMLGAMPTGLPVMSAGKAFRQSVMVELLNPKTALFYVAFLPQFADPSAALPVWSQLLVLGVIACLMFSAMDLVAIFAASAVAGRLSRSTRITQWMQRTGGAILIGLGLHVATQRA